MISISRKRLAGLFALLGIVPLLSYAEPIVRMETSLGNIDIKLHDGVAPRTVDNFLKYVQTGAYDNTFIHRSVAGFVVQGGGFAWEGSEWIYGLTYQSVPATYGSIKNEPFLSNVRGTIAMAKLGSNPDSATTQWFFNAADNPGLDDIGNNGGFTVFGSVTGTGMTVVDDINGLVTCNLNENGVTSAFGVVPLIGYLNVDCDPVTLRPISPPLQANIVLVNSVFEDVDQDAVDDSTQTNVSSLWSSVNRYLSFVSPAATDLTASDIVPASLPSQPTPPPGEVVDFYQSAQTITVGNITTVGGSTTVDIYYPEGTTPTAYYIFGPSPGNPVNHWYEFTYDAATSTGAIVNGNIVTLYLVDGERGDGDSISGLVTVQYGGITRNLVDINRDGIDDSAQTVVVHNNSHGSATFVSPSGTGLLVNEYTLSQGQEVEFYHGAQSIDVNNIITSDGSTTVSIVYPAGSIPEAYYIYGPSSDNPVNHWYEFSYDITTNTGAIINGNMITLHIKDGGPGDANPATGAITVAAGGYGELKNIAELSNIYLGFRTISLISPIGTSFGLMSEVGSVEEWAFYNNEQNATSFPENQMVNYYQGIQTFIVGNITSGDGSTTVTIVYPEGEIPTAYYLYGPSQDNPENHWFDFSYDAATNTGAKIYGNVVVLHLIDGARGDGDKIINGEVSVLLGGIVLSGPLDSQGTVDSESAGCSLSIRTVPLGSAGGWLLILAFLLTLKANTRGILSKGR